MSEYTTFRAGGAGPGNTAYAEILAEVTDDLEREIFAVLTARAGALVRREEIIKAIWGRDVARNTLAADRDDRKLRAAILNLQKRGAPILSGAGAGGYVLTDDEPKLDAYIAELRSRQAELEAKIAGLQKSRRVVRALREYPQRAQQDSLFGMAVYQRG